MPAKPSKSTKSAPHAPAVSAAGTGGGANLRRAARALIAKVMAELVDEDQDWLNASRKRIKTRMSDAKHMAFNNEQKIRLLLLGRPDRVPELEARNRQLEQTANVCRCALEILDSFGPAAPPEHTA